MRAALPAFPLAPVPADRLDGRAPAKPVHAWIDLLRVATIGLVVLNHADIGVDGHADAFDLFLSLVRLPLFFVLSGYLLSGESAPHTVAGTLARDWRRLLVPYLVFGIATWPVWLAHALLHPDPGAVAMPWWRPLLGMAYGADGPRQWLAHDPPIWFLPCLVLVHVLHAALARALPRPGARLAAACVLATLGFAWVRHEALAPPFSADLALVVLPFFALGALARATGWLDRLAAHRRQALAVLVVALPVMWITYQASGRLDLNYRIVPSAPGLYIGGLAGVCGAIALSILLPGGRWLRWQSRHNLTVLCLHSSLLAILHALANRLVPASMGTVDGWAPYPYLATIAALTAGAAIGNWLAQRVPALYGTQARGP